MTVTALQGVSQALHLHPPPSTPVFSAVSKPISADIDTQDGGTYRVTGTTKVKGAPDSPVSRRVRLHDQLSGRVVREVWSTVGTGAYAFVRIRLGVFYVLSLDHTGINNGVIATNVTSETMP